MPAHDHVVDRQHVGGILQNREAVDVRVDNDVGDVAVDEELARQQTDDFVCEDPAVRAADPQASRRLLPR